jgi:hypothetical protein
LTVFAYATYPRAPKKFDFGSKDLFPIEKIRKKSKFENFFNSGKIGKIKGKEKATKDGKIRTKNRSYFFK